MLPVLHLNGYKIANPTVLARIPEQELVALFEGYGWRPCSCPAASTERIRRTSTSGSAALDQALDGIHEIQRAARENDDPRGLRGRC